MHKSVSVVASLLAFTLMSQLYWVYKYHFSGATIMAARAELYKKQYQQEILSHRLTSYEFESFKQDVGVILQKIPDSLKSGEKNYSVRNLASVVLKPQSDDLAKISANTNFEAAKQLFVKRKYEEAARKLQVFIDKFSFSLHVVEAHFLLTECYFQIRHYDKAVKSVEAMVNLFPASEMTGFSLLRMGQIFESQERQQEAAGIYKTIMQAFKDPQVVLQARLALRSLQ